MARDTDTHAFIHGLLAGVCKNRAAITYNADDGGILPDTFLVHSQVSGKKRAFFSGKSRRKEHRYQITYYSRMRETLEPALQSIESAMVAGGFLYISAGPELEHPDTGHWSISCDFRWIEEE